jgi:hypothetical protein
MIVGAARVIVGAARVIVGAARMIVGAARMIVGAARMIVGAARMIVGAAFRRLTDYSRGGRLPPSLKLRRTTVALAKVVSRLGDTVRVLQ